MSLTLTATTSALHRLALRLPIRLACHCLLALLIAYPTGQAQAAAYSLEPIFESLSYRQSKMYRDAAPSGQDNPIQLPLEQDIEQDRQEMATPPAENSALQRLSEEKTQELTLTEQRQGQAIEQELEQFGYSVFQQVLRLAPTAGNMPVPADYRIGPADTLVVQLYGKRNVEYRLVVTREGELLIPEFGPMQVGGLTFNEVKDMIIAGFDTRVIGARAAVTMGEIRTLQVRMTGDVTAPGAYNVSGLSTLVDALLASGGVKYTGSLRRIQVLRQGRTVSTFDLYDLLLRGDVTADITLQHNDVIFVPPIGDVVYVGGDVQRPAIYELADESYLRDVIKMAGGLLPTASIRDSHIERIIASSYRTLVSLDDDSQSVAIQPGDFIRIMPLDDRLDHVVMLQGHVKRPGAYQLSAGMHVSDVINDGDILLRNADLDIAVLKREQVGTKRTLVEYLDIAKILRAPGTSADVLLQPRDEIIILDLNGQRAKHLAGVVKEMDIQATDYRPASVVSLKGHARYTGRLPLPKAARLLDLTGLAGGVLSDTDLIYGIIMRTAYPTLNREPLTFNLGAAMAAPGSGANPLLAPGDTVYLFNSSSNRSALMKDDLARLKRQANYTNEALVVAANGLVRQPGDYPMTSGMRASDLLCGADGLQQNAAALNAELSRFTLDESGRNRITHVQLDAASLVAICADARQQANKAASLALDEARNRAPLVKKPQQRILDVIAPVRFSKGQVQVTREGLAQLEAALAQYQQAGQQLSIVIEGHTDSTPLLATTADRYGDNTGLSRARAEEVATVVSAYLADYHKGHPVDIQVLGHGATKPIAPNDTARGRRQNRRVELHMDITTDAPNSALMLMSAIPVDQSDTGSAVADAELQALSLQASTAPNPRLQPGDQLTFTETAGWTQIARVQLTGEVHQPGTYIIDRGETLCSVVRRAGGLTDNAWPYGATFSRQSIRQMQQKTLDEIQDQLDDLMVELSLSHSVNNQEKTPASGNKDEYYRILRQLKKASPSGRQVIDLAAAMTCAARHDVVLEDGDSLSVPLEPGYVAVVGQVYVPTSHAYRDDRSMADYIELSGGPTVLGRLRDSYAVQANGEVQTFKDRGLRRLLARKPAAGAQIYVPLNVDRMNTTERLQTWTRSLLEVALLAGIVL